MMLCSLRPLFLNIAINDLKNAMKRTNYMTQFFSRLYGGKQSAYKRQHIPCILSIIGICHQYVNMSVYTKF